MIQLVDKQIDKLIFGEKFHKKKKRLKTYALFEKKSKNIVMSIQKKNL